MITHVEQKPHLLFKLTSTRFSLKTSIMKLVSYHASVLEEKKKDEEYYSMLLESYENAASDVPYSEMFNAGSLDTLLSELEKND